MKLTIMVDNTASQSFRKDPINMELEVVAYWLNEFIFL